MSKRNSTVEIVNSKVVFSTEVLSYFENLRTEENSEWIDKYFDVLSNPLNLDAKKYNIHHIFVGITLVIYLAFQNLNAV